MRLKTSMVQQIKARAKLTIGSIELSRYLSFYLSLFILPPSPPLYVVYSLCYRLVTSITAQINLPQNTGGEKEISCSGKIIITTFHIIILLINYSMLYSKICFIKFVGKIEKLLNMNLKSGRNINLLLKQNCLILNKCILHSNCKFF